jgi:hypothetical protein
MSQPSVKKLRQALDTLEETMADPLATSEQVDAAEAAVNQMFSDLETLLGESRERFVELMARDADEAPNGRLERLRAFLQQLFAVDEPLMVQPPSDDE